MKQMLEDNIPIELMNRDLPVGKVRKRKINYQWRSLLILMWLMVFVVVFAHGVNDTSDAVCRLLQPYWISIGLKVRGELSRVAINRMCR
ncbi:hypothetical protein SAMN05444724_1412 [Salinivibrio sp. ES.052]|nr:hypothetical protein SAMN05444724_1412 [Salinivibrio sp. ES.052]